MEPSFKRLGRSELGRYAFESRMPDHIHDIIKAEDDSNNTSGVIPLLRKLLETSDDLEVAHLCNPDAIQVSKIPEEGGHFCGYRNIQMLLLGLPSTERQKLSPGKKPSIPEIQDMIERAWDAGINAHARVQTGGVRGTRKHIGTSETEAILLHHAIPCTGTEFHGQGAWSQLLEHVEEYFSQSRPEISKAKINQTGLPPIFLQRPRHSITIVGVERTKSGQRRLLAFDPAWKPANRQQPAAAAAARPQSSKLGSRWSAYWTLKRYRKDKSYLRRFYKFETLVIDTDILPNPQAPDALEIGWI